MKDTASQNTFPLSCCTELTVLCNTHTSSPPPDVLIGRRVRGVAGCIRLHSLPAGFPVPRNVLAAWLPGPSREGKVDGGSKSIGHRVSLPVAAQSSDC